ncbi:hypothetical protein [Arcanobacterium hippocoleae]|uniref:hypothetical protein n=1 Tax=Arcanobacterium hippocoleae TaxID=149017 RepID=UPI0033425152
MKQMRWIGWGIAVGIPLAFLVFFFAFPVGAMLARGLYGATKAVGNGTDAGSARIVENSLFTGLCTLLTDGYTWQIIWQTVWMALAGTLLSVFLEFRALMRCIGLISLEKADPRHYCDAFCFTDGSGWDRL